MKIFILLSHIAHYLTLHKSTGLYPKCFFLKVLYNWFCCPQVSYVSDEETDVHDYRKPVKEAASVIECIWIQS